MGWAVGEEAFRQDQEFVGPSEEGQQEGRWGEALWTPML